MIEPATLLFRGFADFRRARESRGGVQNRLPALLKSANRTKFEFAVSPTHIRCFKIPPLLTFVALPSFHTVAEV